MTTKQTTSNLQSNYHNTEVGVDGGTGETHRSHKGLQVGVWGLGQQDIQSRENSGVPFLQISNFVFFFFIETSAHNHLQC